jgi:cellobiose-specific phosphotransferase system component IIC
MTTTITATTPSARTHTTPWAVGTALVGVGWSAYGAHTWPELITMSALVVVATGVVFGVVVRRALQRESAARTALTLSVSAVLLALPAFWSGLPLVLGVAGALVGNAGRNARSGSTACITALVVGVVAVAAYLAIYVGDGILAGNAGFLFD